MEFVFTLLKLLPLLLVPLAGLFFLKKAHFIPFNPTEGSTIGVMNAAALLTLWGFIGVESATTPAESVENPQKTIPRALVVGTLLVAIVYIFSSAVVQGVVPKEMLMSSKAPFADAAQIIFGGNWYLMISLAASIVCLGTLNAWVLTSGQIALGASKDGHLPKCFSQINSRGAPKWGIIASSLGIIPVLVLTMNKGLVEQINLMIDVSVTAFLLIYALSVISFLKLFWRNPKDIALGLAALSFCGWALYSSGLKMVAFAGLITLAGLPLYFWRKRKPKIVGEQVLSEELG